MQSYPEHMLIWRELLMQKRQFETPVAIWVKLEDCSGAINCCHVPIVRYTRYPQRNALNFA